MKTETEIKEQLSILKKVRESIYKDLCSPEIEPETADSFKRMINIVDCNIDVLIWVLKPDNLA